MKIFTNKDTKRLFFVIAVIMIVFVLSSQLIIRLLYGKFSLPVFFLALLALCSVLAVCFRYFYQQNKIMEAAVSEIDHFLSGDTDARIACDDEGEMYKLFHSVNTLATVLNAHAQKELQAREFLKGTISDISHQLKTPLAALNIYNGLLQQEAKDMLCEQELSGIKELASLSEQELDRIETLVQNLLKITKLDAGSMVMEKSPESVADMMKDIELHFAYRAKQEQKKMTLSGSDGVTLFCDRDWIIEAISNLVKNALDHTTEGCHIQIGWKQIANLTQITVKDDGKGIHPEDIHHIFKRFYRSRFSQDTSGIGLGLPLAKAIIEAHDGDISVDSVWGEGSTFTINLLDSGNAAVLPCRNN